MGPAPFSKTKTFVAPSCPACGETDRNGGVYHVDGWHPCDHTFHTGANAPDKASEGSPATKIKTNLQWIQQEWRRFLESPQGKKIAPSGQVKLGPEHLAKMFAAFCLDRLRIESEVDDEIG
jgi:hypothetical protein